MKVLFPVILAAITFLVAPISVQAQIVFLSPSPITNASDISTLGTFVDAVGANNFGSPVTIGDTTFTTFFTSDAHISLSDVGGGSDGSGSTATLYQTVLDGVAYNGFGGSPVVGTITLNNLVNNHIYELQIFNGGNRLTNVYGSNTVVLSDSYTIGEFTASGTTQSLTFGTVNPGDAGELGAITLRDITDVVPEPSTYALILGGLAVLGLCLRRKRTSVS